MITLIKVFFFYFCAKILQSTFLEYFITNDLKALYCKTKIPQELLSNRSLMEQIVSGLLKYELYEQVDCFIKILSFSSVLKYFIDFNLLY